MTRTTHITDNRTCPDFFAGQSVTRSTRNRISRKAGEEAQDIVEWFMRENGFRCIERIETGFAVVRRGKQIVGAYPKRPVSGDIKAVGPKGRAVHVEVKHRPAKDNGRLVLKWSDFEPHQIEALERITQAGGWAFVAWVTSLYPARLFWLLWPISGFRKGKALSEADAIKIEPGFFGIRKYDPEN